MKKPELYVLILFIIGFLLRIHSLGILDYPGNIKSCDSTQYYLITDFISENGTYTYPKYLTKGVENVLIARPPIFFLINAPLFSLTSFNGWNVQIFTSLFFNSLLI